MTFCVIAFSKDSVRFLLCSMPGWEYGYSEEVCLLSLSDCILLTTYFLDLVFLRWLYLAVSSFFFFLMCYWAYGIKIFFPPQIRTHPVTKVKVLVLLKMMNGKVIEKVKVTVKAQGMFLFCSLRHISHSFGWNCVWITLNSPSLQVWNKPTFSF